jgi:hypothetical protein
MKVLLVAGVVLAATLVAPLLTPARPASACSPDADYDPVASSETIVAGWLTSWRLLPKNDTSAFTPVHVTMMVQRVYKGNPTSTLTFIDERTYMELPATNTSPAQAIWAASAGACGTFGSDPTGRYAVMGFAYAEDGTLRASGPRTFYLDGMGVGAGEWHERARERLAALGPGRLPRTGAASADLDPAPAVLPTAFGISTLVVVGAILVMPRRERHQRNDLP